MLTESCEASVSSCIDHLQRVPFSKDHTVRNSENLLDL